MTDLQQLYDEINSGSRWLVIMGDGRLFVSGGRIVECNEDWQEVETTPEQRAAILSAHKRRSPYILTDVHNEIFHDLMAMFK